MFTTTNATRKLFWALLGIASLTLCGEVTAQSAPSSVGQWSKPSKWPQTAAHAHLLANGKVLFWPTGDTPQIYDPVAGTFTSATPAGFDIFSSGHAFLPNGQLLVAGGYKGNKVGLPNVAVYDPVGNAWTQLPNMFSGRFLPTNTTLSNGDILVTGGYLNHFVGPNRSLQVWELGPGKWRYLNGASLGLPVDPWMFSVPGNQAFDAGPYPATRLLNPSGVGHWSGVITTKFNSPRDYGTAAMYAPGKVLILGGADSPPTNTAEIIDLNSSNPAWSFTNPMANARQQPNATILPDGTVLVTGGSSGSGFNNPNSPVLAAELWNPATGTWATLASSTVFRGYDSVALLLADGRVLTAGGTHPSGEIFSPPYLFNGARPTITSAPTQVNYGQNFTVTTPDAASITNVTWVSLSSVTHGFNAGQHFNQLSFTQVSGGLQVTAPADPSSAAAGDYMLYILNSNGVPSVASVVQVVAAAPTVVSVGPGSGSTNGATPVTISGTNLLPGATVQIGGVMATNVQVTNSTTITANTPAHAPGAADVVVTNPDYQSSTLPGAYTYTLGQGIAFAQFGFAVIPKVVSSVAPVFPLPQSAGDLNIVVVGWNDATSKISSVTDSSGNSYTQAGSVVVGTNLTQAIYFAKNIVSASTNTVTVQFNQGASYPDVRIFEYAGLDTVNPLDVTNGSSGQSLTASSGSVTTTVATELVFGSDTVLSKTLSPGSGFVPIVFTSFFDLAEHEMTSKIGKFNPSANLDADTNWVMQVVTFKAPGQ
jgi:Domain of unknown function (DUF1929)/IPT/TIG domain/Kelch motif